MTDNTLNVQTEQTIKPTTRRREWWGWFGSIVWLFFMMYGHDAFLQSDYSIEGAGTLYPFFFMLIFALSVAAFSWRFGNNPGGLSRIAFYTTPIVLVITAVFALLPNPFGSVLYAVSPVLMAPAVTRRIFGVIRSAGRGKQLTRFMSCITVCVLAYTAWLIIELPKEIAFLVPAILLIPVWLGIRRSIPLPEEPPKGVGAFQISKRLLLLFAGAFLLLFWLNTMSSVIHTHIVAIGDESSQLLYTLLGFALPPIGFFLFGFISDKGHERTGFICGMVLFLIGILLAFLPSDATASVLIPLSVADGLGGAYAEFFILTIPVYFFENTKRPVFAASLGVALDLFLAAIAWETGVWLPETLQTLDTPVLVSAAISAIGFTILVYFLFERHRENMLAAALYAFLYNKERTESLPVAETPLEPTQPTEAMQAAGFTKQEQEIALLLTEGSTQYEIARKLHIPSADVGQHIKSIRDKIGGKDVIVTAVAKEYNLTRRETDMLRCLKGGMTNVEIASELVLSEETVKTHVRNLLRKLSLDNRSDLRTWLAVYKGKTE